MVHAQRLHTARGNVWWPCNGPVHVPTLVVKRRSSPRNPCLRCAQALPERLAAPPGAAAEFRNGLPLCTDCGAPAPASPPSLTGGDVAREPMSQAGSNVPPHAVLIYVPVACMVSVLVLAVGVGLYWHRRRDGAGRRGQIGSHNACCRTDQGAAAARDGLGPTAVRPPILFSLPLLVNRL